MTFRRLWLACILLPLAAAASAAADKKITAKQLPPAVATAVQEQTRGATIKGYSKEVENGKTSYEVETILNGHSRDLLFDAAGHLLVVEEQVSLDAVPPPVKAAFEAKGKVILAETVTKDGQVTYEAQVRRRNGTRTEVVVNAEGKPVKP